MTDKELTKKSKLLSLVLRHKPEEIGLKLDEEGWAITQELCHKAHLTNSELAEIVEKNNKKRFEYNGDKSKIRACQGHSIEVDLKLEPCHPPFYLYHGTSDRFLGSIRKEGLRAQNRNHVHLSEDQETAGKVGSRHGGETVILVIRAEDYHKTGAQFYKSNNGVWLTREVPVEFIVFNMYSTCYSRGFQIGKFDVMGGVKHE